MAVNKRARVRFPPLFKQRDLARALRSALAAGATKAHVEIAKDGVISMDLDLAAAAANGEDSRDPWDKATEELSKP